MTQRDVPDIRLLVQPFFDKTYAQNDCWHFVADLLEAGGFGRFAADPTQAVLEVQEIWFQDDPRDPLSLVQPWDWYLLRRPKEGPAVRHIGVVMNGMDFIHVRREVGVRIEPLRRWQHWLVQLARLRCLC